MIKLPVSVVIITRNEAALIARAIKSVPFASEVVIVDALSTDNTVKIAREHGARVIERAWTNFSDQRNFALAQAQNDWVLGLDADEAASPELAAWLQEFFAKPQGANAPVGYRVKRIEYFLGRRIYGACWNPSYQDRFFRKSKAHYVGEIHEYPVLADGAEWNRLPEEAVIDHSPNVTVESFLTKMNHYTSIEALDRFNQGQRTSLSHLLVVFFATWWKNFFYYKGYRDGMYGFVICLMEAVSRTVRHIKLWQLQQLKERS